MFLFTFWVFHSNLWFKSPLEAGPTLLHMYRFCIVFTVNNPSVRTIIRLLQERWTVFTACRTDEPWPTHRSGGHEVWGTCEGTFSETCDAGTSYQQVKLAQFFVRCSNSHRLLYLSQSVGSTAKVGQGRQKEHTRCFHMKSQFFLTMTAKIGASGAHSWPRRSFRVVNKETSIRSTPGLSCCEAQEDDCDPDQQLIESPLPRWMSLVATRCLSSTCHTVHCSNDWGSRDPPNCLTSWSSLTFVSVRGLWLCAHITLWLKVCLLHMHFIYMSSMMSRVWAFVVFFCIVFFSPSRASTFSLTVYLFSVLFINFHVVGTAEDWNHCTHAQRGVLLRGDTQLTGYELSQLYNFDYSETYTAIFQNESVDIDTEPSYSCDAELDDELIRKALSSPLFTQERQEPANLRQSYHSHEESLLPAQRTVYRETLLQIHQRLLRHLIRESPILGSLMYQNTHHHVWWVKAKHQLRIRDASQDRQPEILSSLVREILQRIVGQTNNDCRFLIFILTNSPTQQHLLVGRYDSRLRYVLAHNFLRKLCCGSKKWRWLFQWMI